MRTTSLLAPRLAALAVALLTAGAATADTQSLQGLFSRDDERAVFSFTLRQPDRLLARTLSYGGGLNAAGQPIAGGGFAPTLSLFAADFGLLQQAVGSHNACAGTLFCWDAALDLPLGPGQYTLVLTQDGNDPLGTAVTDGFSQDGRPDYTGVDHLGQPGLRFIQVDGQARDGHWALDLTVSAVPEMGSAALLGAGLLLLTLANRRRSA
jgi:hypothetical protein